MAPTALARVMPPAMHLRKMTSLTLLKQMPIFMQLARVFARLARRGLPLRRILRLACVALLGLAATLLHAKRRFQSAKVEWLIKRFVGFAIGRVLPIPAPRVVAGAGAVSRLGAILEEHRCQKPLIVTDEALVRVGLVKCCTDALEAAGLHYEVFDAVVPNPPSELVDEGHERYIRAGCDAIIALGGGSPMDTAKVIGAKVANPKPDITAYEGFFNVNRLGLRPLPPLIAVPTTAGTGSEATVVAVITLVKASKKIMIVDRGLVPLVAVLDPEMIMKLPGSITAATGMDALTHAFESYLSGWSTAFTRRNSLSATSRLFRNMLPAYYDGSNLAARESMLNGSLEAGLAFTRANIGYVHAIAHQLGGLFHTSHGEANAMLLPHVLSYYIRSEEHNNERCCCTELLCQLAVAAGIASASEASPRDGAGKRAIAWRLVDRLVGMCQEMGLPTAVPQMKVSDVPVVAARALAEAHGETHTALLRPKARCLDLGYPVPRYMTVAECQEIVAKVLPDSERERWQGRQMTLATSVPLSAGSAPLGRARIASFPGRTRGRGNRQ
eukprot:TRINITY_DN11812_c0_g3_i1.p1 TRINITY_DN11812_c0_g3~~TRINITY_DN11812_c0_g3_i1.p1  ORF type:complete len:556 (-),score=82.01 TRINITY_DN11812_c0_g3_i1:11-1678(-)